MGSRSVTCHPAEMTFPPLPEPTKAGNRFSDPGVDLVVLVRPTYRGGIRARRHGPVLTELSVE